MRVRILGPVDVLVGGAPRAVRGLRRNALLAVLALNAAEIVSTDRLIDAVWGEQAPATAANTLQSHVSHLRGVLGGRTAIEARSPGSVVLIFGEVGIGKSSLVEAIGELLPPTSRLLVGHCDDLGAPRPLGPFRDRATGPPRASRAQRQAVAFLSRFRRGSAPFRPLLRDFPPRYPSVSQLAHEKD